MLVQSHKKQVAVTGFECGSHFPFLSGKVLCFLDVKHCWLGESFSGVGEKRW